MREKVTTADDTQGFIWNKLEYFSIVLGVTSFILLANAEVFIIRATKELSLHVNITDNDYACVVYKT